MNFYEFYRILSENTISQELKNIKDKNIKTYFDLDEILKETKKELKAAFLEHNINEKSLNALSKWIIYHNMDAINIMINSPDIFKQNCEIVIRTAVLNIKNFCGDYLISTLDNTGNFNQNLISQFNNKNFIFIDLQELSDKYHKELLKQRGGVGSEGETVISFPDGYKWVDLKKGYCEKEGRAGLHCGNIGAIHGDTILSLRDEKNFVILTFVLNNGILEERKAKGNKKPDSKYHPYIIELLKLPIIKGIGKGRYLPEEDFQLSDLNNEQKENLLRNKPEAKSWMLLEDFEKFIKEDRFSGKKSKELSLLIKFYNEVRKHRWARATRRNVDEFFSESEILELLNNKNIEYVDKMYGGTLDVPGTIARKTKYSNIHDEILKKYSDLSGEDWNRNIGILTKLGLNTNISKKIEKALIEKDSLSTNFYFLRAIANKYTTTSDTIKAIFDKIAGIINNTKLNGGAVGELLTIIKRNTHTPPEILAQIEKL